MLTAKKLRSMRRENRLKHIIRIVERAETDATAGKRLNTPYLLEILDLILEESPGNQLLNREILPLRAGAAFTARSLNSIRHHLLVLLGCEPADWDMRLPSGKLDPSQRTVLPIRLFLEDIRSPFNVGALFRTAESFGVQEVLLSPGSAPPTHPRAVRSAMGCIDVLPWKILPAEDLPEDEPVFALETGGTPLHAFPFPRKGIMILGSEEMGVSPQARERAYRSCGLVSIPLGGSKKSLNVSVACGIALYNWYSRISATREELSQSQAD